RTALRNSPTEPAPPGYRPRPAAGCSRPVGPGAGKRKAPAAAAAAAEDVPRIIAAMQQMAAQLGLMVLGEARASRQGWRGPAGECADGPNRQSPNANGMTDPSGGPMLPGRWRGHSRCRGGLQDMHQPEQVQSLDQFPQRPPDLHWVDALARPGESISEMNGRSHGLPRTECSGNVLECQHLVRADYRVAGVHRVVGLLLTLLAQSCQPAENSLIVVNLFLLGRVVA